MSPTIARRLAAAVLATVTLASVAISEPGSASVRRVTQEAPMRWHAQSGNSGDVAESATATLVRTPQGVRYRIETRGLLSGNAYSVWFVVINDPSGCSAFPCPGPEFIGNPALDAQVTWGRDGAVAQGEGVTRFGARIGAGPLLEGWLPVQGLDDPMHAEIHLVLNDHGPVIDGMRHEMLSTYRAGCSDSSPFPAFFPATALADGTPGPNTCRLFQTAAFAVPGS